MRVTGVDTIEMTQVVHGKEPFDSFYYREYHRVVALAYALSGSRSAAEDLAQEGFIAAYRSWDRVAEYDVPGAFVRRVVANRCVSRVRRRVVEARTLRRLAGRSQQAPLPELSEDAERLWSLVRALPKRQAQAVALHYLEDRSLDEIGEILGCSPGTVKTHLHRARRSLSRSLDLAKEAGS